MNREIRLPAPHQRFRPRRESGGRMSGHPGTAIRIGEELYEVVSSVKAGGSWVYRLEPWTGDHLIRVFVEWGDEAERDFLEAIGEDRIRDRPVFPAPIRLQKKGEREMTGIVKSLMAGRSIAAMLLFVASVAPGWAADQKRTSIILENLTWPEAEKTLRDFDVVLFAVGARSKEHGPHLPLNTDFLTAEYLKDRVARETPVAILPTLEYGYYPSFLEYPGSVSLGAETFKNTVVDICTSMKGHGIRKFYVLNTGISTVPPLLKAAEELLKQGILMRYLDLRETDKKLPPDLMKQKGGTHADEGETSMMLFIAPEKVDMTKAVKDYDARPNRKGLTRDPQGAGVYSPTGIWGDPTLATREKGRIIVETTVEEIVKQIAELRANKSEK